jgi:hypothetical protein
MNPLTVSDVQIQTATVSIRTLVLGKKQMTLSEFRQLPEEPLINDQALPASDGGLRPFIDGEPWGLVNYFWTGCGMEGEHLHVVFTRDGKLFRSCVGKLSVDTKPWSCERTFRGDRRGLHWLGRRHDVYAGWEPEPPGYHYADMPNDARKRAAMERDIEIWNGLRNQLARLDQLFIAV